MPQDCPPENDIAELAAGVLRGPRRLSLEEHLDGCAHCRAMVAELAASHAPAVTAGSGSRERGDDAAPPRRLPQRGDTIGRYVILAWLGQGGMGAVYRARDGVLQREVALKVIDLDAPGARRVMREARTGAALEHPNVVATFDVGETEGVAFLAMELVKGVTLRERMTSDASLAERVAWLTAIASALAGAHARGIVHRDVKPENVMVRDDGIVKVLDFGLARWEAASDGLTAKGAVIGTPAYMAPEQLEGAVADARSDQFAWGVVAYEVLNGARPWSVATREAVGARREWSDEVPPGVRSVVERALAWEAGARFAEMADVVEGMLALTSDLHAASRASAPSRKSWGARAVGLTALLVILLDALYARPKGPPPAKAHQPPSLLRNAGAVEAYAAGVRAFHDGSLRDARRAFENALAIEPDFAEAALRSAMLTDNADTKRRELLRTAQAQRKTLQSEDQALLDALLPLADTPPRWDEADARLSRLSLTAQTAEPLVILGVSRLLSHGDYEGAVSACASAIEREPRHGLAGWCLANSHVLMGNAMAARHDVARCTDASPAATSCLRIGAMLAEGEGRCQDELDVADRLASLEPAEPLWQQFRANALFALGREADARAALAIRVRLLPPSSRKAEDFVARMDLATLAGDFVAAEAYARAWNEALRTDTDEFAHYLLLTLEALVLLESGRRELANERADEYLRAYQGWTPNDGAWSLSIAAYAFKHLAGTLDSKDFARARLQWMNDEEARDAHRKFDRAHLWYPAYARPATNGDDARVALAALPSLANLRTRPLHDLNREEPIGRVLLLAGSYAEAIRSLRIAASSCGGLELPIYWMRARFELGQALEATGDTAGACEAYRGVAERWSHARPRSLSAEAARARRVALKCPAP